VKKTLKINLVILLFCSIAFPGCKKGEGDPAISFRTRKARMVGEWRLKSGSAGLTHTKPGSPTLATGYVFDGSTAQASETEVSGPPTIYIFAFLLNINIKKDGTFILTENYGSYSLIASGTWNFTSGIGENKNKEEVLFIIDKVNAGDIYGHLFNKQSIEFTYKITELRDKELRIEAGTKEYLNANGEQLSYTGSYEMKQ